ncbi:hypothetical protein SAMN05428954_4745 [Streptomyces sp. 2112.3]|nr:hypothetical protein BX261_2496 [Streptomyces sp. 2321.6]SDR48644.1 hypothetical protein SAMN05216511_4707 [Streptomyces sp. KS_16]SEC64092.1 hypothetical protein SAMN05428940_2499 [Streptomyces sp. 2133.1]SEE95303.1 hypothetical protein SAMN05428954_4745 [Streptomyces sp. 2112.3]SNC68668.1 hypothetical protein SAMN06272741_2493 [Streptomyces sp. 2114.4]
MRPSFRRVIRSGSLTAVVMARVVQGIVYKSAQDGAGGGAGARHFDTGLVPILPLSTDIEAIAEAPSLWVFERIPCVKGPLRTGNSPADPPSTGKGGRRAEGFPAGVRRRVRRSPPPERTSCSGDLRGWRRGRGRRLRECAGRLAEGRFHGAFGPFADSDEVTSEYADLAEGVATFREGGRGNLCSPGLWVTAVEGVPEAPSVGDGVAISGVLLPWPRRRRLGPARPPGSPGSRPSVEGGAGG